MYLDFFGLRELPFELTANPRFLYMTVAHREALSSLQFGVQARKGLTLLVGEVGTGKTTLIAIASHRHHHRPALHSELPFERRLSDTTKYFSSRRERAHFFALGSRRPNCGE